MNDSPARIDPEEAADSRRRPRGARSRPPSARTPGGPTLARYAGSTLGSTAASSTTWPSRRTSPSCTTPGALPRAPRWRTPRRPFARSSPVSRPESTPAGERTARVLAGYRRIASGRGRGQARACRCGDRGTAVSGRDAAQRSECVLRWADVANSIDGDGMLVTGLPAPVGRPLCPPPPHNATSGLSSPSRSRSDRRRCRRRTLHRARQRVVPARNPGSHRNYCI